ncbi:MAG: MFS transporter [Propionibacteriaceae bacterium]
MSTSTIEESRPDSLPAAATAHRPHTTLIVLYLALGGLSFAVLQSLVAPALSTIGTDLNVSTSNISWILTAYLLSASVLTPILGRLGDMVGKRKILIVVLGLLLVGTLLAALAPNLGVLIAARALQGAAGAVMPLSIGIVRDELPREKVSVTIGLLSAIFGIGAGVGIVAAGPIVQHLSWHWLFWFPLALVVIALIGVIFGMPESPVRKPGRLDLVGTAILSVALVSLLLAITEGETWAWDNWKTLSLLALGAVALVAFVLVELRVREPLIDVRLFKIRGVWTAHVVALVFGFAMFGTFVLVPTLLQLPSVLGYGFGKSVSQSGLFLLPTVVMMVIAGPVAGFLVRKVGPKTPMILGALSVTAAFVLPAVSHGELWQVVVSGLLTGIGIGLALAALSNSIIENVPAEQTGEAIGANTIARTIGSSVGTAVIAALISSHATPQGLPTDDAFTIGFWVCAGVGALAILGSLAAPSRRRSRREPVANRADAHPVTSTPSANGQASPNARRAVLVSVNSEPPAPVAAQPETGLAVSGTVRQNAGRVLPGAQITLADQSGQQVARTVSDNEGHYRLPLQHGGSLLLIVAATGLAPTAILVAVTDQPLVRDITLVGRSAITGRVLKNDPESERSLGVADALITLTDAHGQVIGSTRSGADGGYSFEGLVAGSYVLTAQGSDPRPLARGVEVSESGAVACDLTLAGGGRLTGTVIAASDGHGVREAAVTLIDAQGQVVATTTTGESGDYLFDNLDASRYTLIAAGYAPVALEVVVDEDAVSSLQVELGSPAQLREPERVAAVEQE